MRARNIRTASCWSIAVACGIVGGLLVSEVRADTHTTGVPQLSSLPGAPYTIYLDFAGFNFTGNWGGGSSAPGNTPAFDNVTGSFNSFEQNKISRLWARVAQCYTPFNVNVTTIDPAVAGGQADTDAHRQAYYDLTPQMMHTVIGQQQNNWCGPYGGISYVGVDPYSYDPSSYNNGAGAGWKTNWVFTDGVGTGLACGQAAAHENGHGLNLSHQSDYSGATYVNEYSKGDNNSGNGTYAPIMGAAYYTQRGAWRVGDSNNGSANNIQNDVSVLLRNPNIGRYVNDGIGHTLATATLLPVSGNNVNAALAKGIIVPASTTSPTPIGASNYTSDFFRFYANGGVVSLTAHNGSEFLSAGTADPGAMLRSTLTILDSSGTTVGTATEAASTLSETFFGTLPAGWYYAQIASYGGHSQTLGSYNTTSYFDMGSFFLTGSGISVPEPGTLVMLLVVVCLGIARLRRTRGESRLDPLLKLRIAGIRCAHRNYRRRSNWVGIFACVGRGEEGGKVRVAWTAAPLSLHWGRSILERAISAVLRNVDGLAFR